MHVTADPDACCASGMCAMTAPDVFDQSDEDGTVVVLQPEPPAALAADVRQAAQLCPARAITVSE